MFSQELEVKSRRLAGTVMSPSRLRRSLARRPQDFLALILTYKQYPMEMYICNLPFYC